MEAGFATVDYTPEPGLALQGQMHERRATHARDPLQACAAAFRSGDEPPVVVVAIDLCTFRTDGVAAVQRAFAARTGLDGRRLLVSATHSHVAPCSSSFLRGDADPRFVDALWTAIVSAAEASLAALEPVTLHAGSAKLEQLGWNRRGMFADGTSRMYGGSSSPGFVGLEGPRDPELSVLATRDAQGELRGVVLSFGTHPNCLESECFYSADLPGEVRRLLRAVHGPGCGVVYLTGPAGNVAPSVLDPQPPTQPWRGEVGLRRSGEYLAGAALQVVAAAHEPLADVLRLEQAEPLIGLRPWPEPDAPNYPLPLRGDTWPDARGYYERQQALWPTLPDPEPVRLNVLRLGEAALCTSPTELFVEHGLCIRADSPARVNLLAELTDGYCGYVPTTLAFSRGGYETWPAYSSRLACDAGERIAAETAALLRRAWA